MDALLISSLTNTLALLGGSHKVDRAPSLEVALKEGRLGYVLNGVWQVDMEPSYCRIGHLAWKLPLQFLQHLLSNKAADGVPVIVCVAADVVTGGQCGP